MPASIHSSVYISYIIENGDLRERIAQRLRRAEIEVWDNASAWNLRASQAELERGREHCRVFVLIISPRYLDSEVIRKSELPSILSLPDKGRRIICVIAEPCLWETVLPRQRYVVVPYGGTPLSARSEKQIEDDLDILVREVGRAIQETDKAAAPPQDRVSPIDLGRAKIDPSVIKLIPRDTAVRDKLMPIARAGSVLTIAMADPTNVFAMDDIKFMTGFNVEPKVASESAIAEAIRKFYGEEGSTGESSMQNQSHLNVPTQEAPPVIEQNEGLPASSQKVPPTDVNQVRINELARELDVKAKAIIDLLPEYGVTEKKTHSSSIPADVAEKVRKKIQGFAETQVASSWITQETFNRFSKEALDVLSRANRIHQEFVTPAIYTRHLLLASREHAINRGKEGSATRLTNFVLAHDRDLLEVLAPVLPIQEGAPSPLKRPPPTSANVRSALLTAISKAGTDGPIDDSHVLFGVLSTVKNAAVRELNKRGMTPDKVVLPFPAPPAALTPKIVSDRWSEEDTLGYGAYARTLAGVIAHEDTVPPLTIGIKAPWGAGKTSLMKQVQYILDGDSCVTEKNEAAVANKEVIEKAKQLSLLDSSVPLGWRFMEKIVQLPINIPPPTEAGIRGYTASLTGTSPSTEKEAASLPDREKVEEWKVKLDVSKTVGDVVNMTDRLMAQASQEDRLAVAEASKQKYAEKFTDRDPLVNKFVEEVVGLVGGNPRQIKRYVNVFRFHSTLRHNLKVDSAAHGLQAIVPSDKGLAKFLALTIQWPHAAEFLRTTRATRTNAKAGSKPVSLLKLLEEKSRTIKGPAEKADAGWVEFLKIEGLEQVEWVATRSFRLFLGQGESLSEIEGCGLW